MSSISICSIGGGDGKKPNRRIPIAGKPQKQEKVRIVKKVIYKNNQIVPLILSGSVPFTLEDIKNKREECDKENDEFLRFHAMSLLNHLYEDGPIPEEEIERVIRNMPYRDRPHLKVVEMWELHLSNGKVDYELVITF